MSTVPTFSVVIPTKRRPEPLRRTLESLRQAEPAPDEVLVIDADDERSARQVVVELQAVHPALRYVDAPASLTEQRNLGLDLASGEVVVFIDDDVSLPRDVFARLARAYGENGVIGVTCRIVEPHGERLGGPRSPLRRLAVPGSRRQAGTFTRYGYPRYVAAADGPCEVEFMPGCFMSARSELAKDVRFDEHLDAYGLAEDEDFSYRLSRRGRLIYLPDLVVVHEKLGFRSFDSREFGRLVVRNRAYLFRKNFPQTRTARLQFGALLAMLVAHRLLNREWRGALGVLEGARDLVCRRG